MAKYAIFEKVGPRCACDAAGTGPVPVLNFLFCLFCSLVFYKGKQQNMVRGGAAELQRGRRTQVPRGQIREGRYKHQGV